MLDLKIDTTKRRLISRDEVKARYGNPSDVTIWRYVRDRIIPAPVRLAGGKLAWVEDEIDADINRHIADRASAQAA